MNATSLNTPRRPTPRIVRCLAIAVSLTITMASRAADIGVTPIGSFAPDGTVNAAYSLVEAAVCAANPGDNIYMLRGRYFETLTIQKPLTLEADSTPVTIGETPPHETTLQVVTYNTHLFGGTVLDAPYLTWLDGDRAFWIRYSLGTMIGADIIALQETWDTSLGNYIRDNLTNRFPHSYYGTRTGFLKVQHSGLLTLSAHPLSNNAQIDYTNSNGTDFLATKGILRNTIYKDGFSIGVFNTHMQADDNDTSIATRRAQLDQLARAVDDYRAANPHHVVVVLGDFNIIAGSTEYYDNMALILELLAQLSDGAANERCNPESLTCTSCSGNALGVYFGGGDHDWRLDYVLYAGSRDGMIDLQPDWLDRVEYQVPLSNPPLSYDGLTTRQLSDHYAVRMQFRVFRR